MGHGGARSYATPALFAALFFFHCPRPFVSLLATPSDPLTPTTLYACATSFKLPVLCPHCSICHGDMLSISASFLTYSHPPPVSHYAPPAHRSRCTVHCSYLDSLPAFTVDTYEVAYCVMMQFTNQD